MLSRTNLIILGLALMAAIGGGWLQHCSRLLHVPPGVHITRVGELRPDLALPDLQGHEHRLSEFQGRRVLLNFWATWCVPCLREIPALNAAQGKFDHEVMVLGIAMDDPMQVRAFLATHPVKYPILIGELHFPSTSLRFGDVAEVLPFSVLLDEHGRVLATHAGALDTAQLTSWMSSPDKP